MPSAADHRGVKHNPDKRMSKRKAERARERRVRARPEGPVEGWAIGVVLVCLTALVVVATVYRFT